MALVPKSRTSRSSPSSGGGEVALASSTVHAELEDLQRRYRMMEVTRQRFADDPQNTIRRQRQQIEKLKKDNDRLKEDLALETRQAKQANNMTASAQIAKLQDQGDTYARKIEIEKRRIEELDKQIKKMEETILLQRKEMGGVNASRENNQQVQKQIRILENRLDKALVKFNEALAHNKQLRESIENLRRERVVFDSIYRKLERELHEKKNKMAAIIEISNASYEARDAAHSEMVALKSQADREQMHFEQEWSQLGRLIEKDRKMKDFLKTDASGKVLLDSRGFASRAAFALTDGSMNEGKNMDPAVEEEQRLRKRVNKGAWGIARDKANIHLSMEKVQSYEEAFAKIQKATKINNIEELVETFVKAEDQNFSLFNYVNDLANEIDKLEESIAQVKGEIAKYRGQGVSADTQRKKILEDLQGKLQKTENQAIQYEEKYSAAMKTVNSLKEGIESVFSKIGCEASSVNEVLGNGGVTESNMMTYLGIIERRTNELLSIYHEQNNTMMGGPLSSSLQPSQPSIQGSMGDQALSIQAPSLSAHDSDDDSADEDVMPDVPALAKELTGAD